MLLKSGRFVPQIPDVLCPSQYLLNTIVVNWLNLMVSDIYQFSIVKVSRRNRKLCVSTANEGDMRSGQRYKCMFEREVRNFICMWIPREWRESETALILWYFILCHLMWHKSNSHLHMTMSVVNWSLLSPSSGLDGWVLCSQAMFMHKAVFWAVWGVMNLQGLGRGGGRSSKWLHFGGVENLPALKIPQAVPACSSVRATFERAKESKAISVTGHGGP
jgi:hypothetical protein